MGDLLPAIAEHRAAQPDRHRHLHPLRPGDRDILRPAPRRQRDHRRRRPTRRATAPAAGHPGTGAPTAGHTTTGLLTTAVHDAVHATTDDDGVAYADDHLDIADNHHGDDDPAVDDHLYANVDQLPDDHRPTSGDHIPVVLTVAHQTNCWPPSMS